ncbi:serine/threonine protein kinase [Dethiobacter alkaliphilus]|uniref:serine/threonine protein kinase n=1 Tax=Dethiobacter alkaliphilus TaxID=427926 RepID=UPI0022271455|nr:serine/threonine-protein kinase [Dethiobacter alkaliphilus]MCW3488700.1 serine/threonine protein kinase [Dethiobacter alkaliphilus]
MDKSRHISEEKTMSPAAGATEYQPVQEDEVSLLPSLGRLPAETEIAGRYRVEEELAMSGGEADVFRCRDKETGNIAAVKVYRSGKSPNQELVEKLSELKHENLVHIQDLTKWSNRFIEVMEFAVGGTLAEHVPFNEDFLVKVVIPQVVEGLHFLHQKNVIHRDLKPSNLFFSDTTRSRILIADYGISSLIQEWEGSRHLTSSVKGTLDYRAPETYSGYFGKEIDYYSLGITLLVLLTGESPLQGMSEQEKMHYHFTVRILPPRDCSGRFTNLIDGLLHKLRDRRWGYEEVKDWLQGKNVSVPAFATTGTIFRYTLAKGEVACTPEELGELMLKYPEEAKSQIKKRLVYEALKKTDQYLASRIDDIQSAAANMDECLVEVAHTLNPEMPYRLMEGVEAKTPAELAALIDRDAQTWEAGKEQLVKGMIPAWLRAAGYTELAETWKEAAGLYGRRPG